MSKKEKEKKKLSIDELRRARELLRREEMEKRMKEARDVAEKYRDQVKEVVEERPIESALVIFFVGFILGILFGAATSKRG